MPIVIYLISLGHFKLVLNEKLDSYDKMLDHEPIFLQFKMVRKRY